LNQIQEINEEGAKPGDISPDYNMQNTPMGFGQLSRRNIHPSTSSLTRGRGFQIFRRTSNSPSGKKPSLQVRKAQLKESLLKYKDK
jgi:hypothetical protein